MARVLDGVPIKTDRTGKYCARNCPLLKYNYGTVCGLELLADKRRPTRYNTVVLQYDRCPLCLKLERKAAKR